MPEIGKRHESGAFNYKRVSVGIAGLTLGFLLAAGLMAVLLHQFQERDRSKELPPEALPVADAPYSPQYAPLSTKQTKELHELRAWEQSRLSTYGWVDRDAEIARIPIEQALEILASQGIPTKVPGTPLEQRVHEVARPGDAPGETP